MCWPARLPNYIYDYNSHIIPNNQCPDPKTCLGTLEVFHIFWWQGDDFKSPLRALDGTHALSIVLCSRQISRCIEIFRSSITRVYIYVYTCTCVHFDRFGQIFEWSKLAFVRFGEASLNFCPKSVEFESSQRYVPRAFLKIRPKLAKYYASMIFFASKTCHILILSNHN